MKFIFLALAFLFFSAVTAQADEVIVRQSHSSFDVSGVTLNAGDTIVFKNGDNYAHDIEITSRGETDDRGLQRPDQDLKYTFDKKGIYEVRCSIHARMGMIVTVR